MIGAKLYGIPKDRGSFFQTWKDIGLDTAFLGPEIWRNPGDFPRELRREGIQHYLILQTFFDPQMEDHPEDYAITEDGSKAKDDWVTFCCPRAEGFLEKRISQLKEGIQLCAPRGISIDFIRYFAFWEMVTPENWQQKLKDSCFCPRCLRAFSKEQNLTEDLESWETSQAAQWIHAKHAREWEVFKCRTITEAFQKVVHSCRALDPDLKIFFHGLPWTEEDYRGARQRIGGQDFSSIGKIAHYISPMCYTHMLYKDANWLSNLVKTQENESRTPIIPAIQVSECYRKTKFKLIEFTNAVSSCLNSAKGNIILWSWEQLKASPEKLLAFKDILKKRDLP